MSNMWGRVGQMTPRISQRHQKEGVGLKLWHSYTPTQMVVKALPLVSRSIRALRIAVGARWGSASQNLRRLGCVAELS